MEKERADGEKELKEVTVRRRRGERKVRQSPVIEVQVTQPIPSSLTFIPLFAQRSCRIL